MAGNETWRKSVTLGSMLGTKEDITIKGSVLAMRHLQPTVIASRAPHLLLEQSVMTIQRIVDVNRGRASPVKKT